MKPAINWVKVFTITCLLSLFIIYSFLWLKMINTHVERTGSDFIGLFTGARLSQLYGYSAIYDIEKQQNLQAEVIGFEFHPNQTGYFTHPPFIVPLVRLITTSDYTASLIRWTIILLALNALTVYLLVQTLPQGYFSKEEAWILGLGAFLFTPTFSGLMNGQDTAVLALGTAIWMHQFFSNKPALSGLGLSLSAIRPQMAILYTLPFIFKHQRVFWGALIGGFGLAIFSLLLIGPGQLPIYLHIIQVVESGMWNLPHATDMPTLSGFIRRNFENMNQGIYRNQIWSVFLIGLTTISIWWKKSDKITEKHVGLVVILGLLLVPYAHYHELTLLLIPIFCLIRIWSKEGLISAKKLMLLPSSISLLLLFGFAFPNTLKYIFVYSVIVLLGYFLSKNKK
ncbi:MAG: DUF2029 domain-containing protein [Anaerolineae bacterium]|nr:DUF2029 domain-containing protein [Anaerolineae bacterium]